MFNISIARYILIVLLFIIFDVLWFSKSGAMYNSTVKSIQGSEITMNYPAAIIAWMLLGVGVASFAQGNIVSRATNGALLGLTIYGTYNATNKAIFKDYDTKTALADTAWGVLVTTVVSVLYPMF